MVWKHVRGRGVLLVSPTAVSWKAVMKVPYFLVLSERRGLAIWSGGIAILWQPCFLVFEGYLSVTILLPKYPNPDKPEIRNPKWFDQLTTLSQAEGQIRITKIQMTQTDS